jgi:hypothetical protein
MRQRLIVDTCTRVVVNNRTNGVRLQPAQNLDDFKTRTSIMSIGTMISGTPTSQKYAMMEKVANP